MWEYCFFFFFLLPVNFTLRFEQMLCERFYILKQNLNVMKIEIWKITHEKLTNNNNEQKKKKKRDEATKRKKMS